MITKRARERALGFTEHVRLDDTDRHILKLLQEDGRTTNADLAREVSLSAPSTLERVRKLEKGGLITGYTALLDPERLGYGLIVVAMVSLALHQEQPIDSFRKQAAKFPEVLECLHVSGDYDFMLKIVARDMRDYEQFVTEKLSAIKGVGKIHSCFVLGVNKSTTALPV